MHLVCPHSLTPVGCVCARACVQLITIGNERFRCPEVLFAPSMVRARLWVWGGALGLAAGVTHTATSSDLVSTDQRARGEAECCGWPAVLHAPTIRICQAACLSPWPPLSDCKGSSC